MLFAIASILLTWAILAVSFVGVGRGLLKAVGGRTADDAFAWVTAFWMGYAAVLCILQLWNFWLPINGYPLLITVLVGATLAASEGPAWIRFIKGRRWTTVGMLVLVAIWVADRALGPGNADDSGNYHYTVIRWANEYPAVPGLANLSAVYTYNNASLLYAAMLNTGPWAGRGEHVTNGLLVIALFAQVLPALLRLARGAPRAGDLFDLVLLTPAVMLTLGKDLPSPKTDLPAGILTLLMARVALGVFLGVSRRVPQVAVRRDLCSLGGAKGTGLGVPRPVAPHGGAIVALGVFAGALVALKLSAGLIALLLFAIPVVHWIYSDRPGRAAWRPCGLAVLGGLLLVGPWVARNVILNGYPLYPSKVIPIPVAWRVPGPVVDLVRDNVGKQSKAGILFWLRDTLRHNGLNRYARLVDPPFGKDEVPKGLSWVRPWVFSLPVSSLVEIVLPAGVCAMAGLLLLRRRATASPPWGWLVVAPIAALAFWFVTAPDPRFGWAPAWTLAALAVAWAYERRGWVASRRALRVAVVTSVALVVPTLGFRLLVLKVQKQVTPLRQVPFQWPGPDHGFWPHPTIAFEPTVNRWGVTVYMPVEKGNAMTWGGPLPCAGWDWPPNNPDLRMRRAGSVAAGFVTDRGENEGLRDAPHR